jgi:hydroxymethylbilane synthase
VARRIEAELGRETELVVIKTTGDRIQNVSLAKIGGKGLFIKEIEEALLAGRADVAVHSAKDLPAHFAPGLVLSAFPERADPRDALLTGRAGVGVEDLPEGARVGTGSTRRGALLRAARPDIEIVPLRGNVQTRMEKRISERLDAIVLACAGLDRLGLAEAVSERISPDVLLPAVCQGMLALESREDDPISAELGALSNEVNATLVAAERGFLEGVGGDCTTPLAAYCEIESGQGDATRIRLRGLIADLDGARVVRDERRGAAREAAVLGAELAHAVLDAGGREILASLREADAGASS